MLASQSPPTAHIEVVEQRGCVLSRAYLGVSLPEAMPEQKAEFLLIADAFLTNRARLQAELRAAGSLEKENLDPTDETLIQAAWATWGVSCTKRLCGEFAFAVYEQQSKRLTLVRDQNGQRPLFYALQDDAVVFASTPNSLLGWSELRVAIRLERLAGVIAGSRYTGWDHHLSPIMFVRPAEVVQIDGSSLRRERYWPNAPNRSTRPTDIAYVAKKHRRLLEQIVTDNLRDSGELIVTHLSSGWDSGAVTGFAARLKGQDRVIGTTSVPQIGSQMYSQRGRHADEGGKAALIAQTVGIKHVRVTNESRILAEIEEWVEAIQDPYFNQVNIGWWAAINRKAKALGARVVLTAQTGNESMNTGGLWALGYLARAGSVRQWWHEARLVKRANRARWRGILFSSFSHKLPVWVRLLLTKGLLRSAGPSWKQFLRPAYRSAAKQSIRDEERRLGHYLDSIRIGLLRQNDDALIRRAMLMKFGIEERDVMADARALNFGLQLPTAAMIAEGVIRPAARQSLKSLLPEEILESKTRGFQGADWPGRISATECNKVMEELLRSQIFRRLISPERIRNAIGEWEANPHFADRFPTLVRFTIPRLVAVGFYIRNMERRLALRTAA